MIIWCDIESKDWCHTFSNRSILKYYFKRLSSTQHPPVSSRVDVLNYRHSPCWACCFLVRDESFQDNWQTNISIPLLCGMEVLGVATLRQAVGGALVFSQVPTYLCRRRGHNGMTFFILVHNLYLCYNLWTFTHSHLILHYVHCCSSSFQPLSETLVFSSCLFKAPLRIKPTLLWLVDCFLCV